MRNLIFKQGFEFGFDISMCNLCKGRCCCGESGYIWVTKDEIVKISKFLELKEETFKRKYLKKIKYRFSLKEIYENSQFQCVFFDKKTGRCKIYEVRPSQCQSFPFWERYKDKKNLNEVIKECPGVFLLQ
jgi:Fe-S-cluster containining protein